jgi:hypothetical protein
MEPTNTQLDDSQKNKLLSEMRNFSPAVGTLEKVVGAIGMTGVGEVSEKSEEFIIAHPAERYSTRFLISIFLFCLIGSGVCMSLLFTWYTSSIVEGVAGGVIFGILFALFFFYRFFLGSGLKKK